MGDWPPVCHPTGWVHWHRSNGQPSPKRLGILGATIPVSEESRTALRKVYKTWLGMKCYFPVRYIRSASFGSRESIRVHIQPLRGHLFGSGIEAGPLLDGVLFQGKNYPSHALMVELADTAHSKCAGEIRLGSSPSLGTKVRASVLTLTMRRKRGASTPHTSPGSMGRILVHRQDGGPKILEEEVFLCLITLCSYW